MKLSLDTVTGRLAVEEHGRLQELSLYSPEGFGALGKAWLKVGWNQKYSYTFTWLGRPIIQLPEDLIRIQEVIYQVKPDVIIETGVAHGGSVVYYASLLSVIGHGRVIGIDTHIRPHNRKAIEEHELADKITLIEGDSSADATVAEVRKRITPGEGVMVILDSNHTKAHVLAELELYGSLVTKDSYIVVADGIMKDLTEVPRGVAQWKKDNPHAALLEFVTQNREFKITRPPWSFNESELEENLTEWPDGYLRRVALS